MREEIAKWYHGASSLLPSSAISWKTLGVSYQGHCYARTDELLGLLRSKIEAVKNPYTEAAKRSLHSRFHMEGFEDCRREVLALFTDAECIGK